jgi:exopolysaccharide biosynthesis polyprenyl glycosylphosphotransferase
MMHFDFCEIIASAFPMNYLKWVGRRLMGYVFALSIIVYIFFAVSAIFAAPAWEAFVLIFGMLVAILNFGLLCRPFGESPSTSSKVPSSDLTARNTRRPSFRTPWDKGRSARRDTPVYAARTPFQVPPWSRWHFVAAVQIADTIAILCGSAISIGIHGMADIGGATAITTAAAIAVFAHSALRLMGAYDEGILTKRYISGVAAAASWLLGIGPFLLLIATQYPQGSVTRSWIITWLISTTILIIIFRGIAARIGVAFQRSGLLGHTICIIGAGNEARSCSLKIRRDQTDLVLLGYFGITECNPKMTIDVPHLGKLTHLSEFLLQHRVDELIVATPLQQCRAIGDVISYLNGLPVSLTIWPESVRLPTDKTYMDAADGRVRDLPLLRVGAAPLRGWRYLLKDILDRILALAILIASLPIFVLILIGIRLSSPGPVFLREMRRGCHGREFHMLKFRTMVSDAIASQPIGRIRTARDPRIFPFGALLRKTYLNDLPQLLNVLAGDMWLIGPRPHSRSATAVVGWLHPDASRQYLAQHHIKPGITGWAQVNGWLGSCNTSEHIEQRIAHDLYYIENWSPLLDLRILIMTLMFAFGSRSSKGRPTYAMHDMIGWVFGRADRSLLRAGRRDESAGRAAAQVIDELCR